MNLDERMKYAAMKARHKKKLRPWYKKGWGISVIALGVIFLLFITVFALAVQQQLQILNNPKPISEEIANTYIEAINRPSVNVLGPVDAPITIVEFADFSCPFCRDSHASLKNIREKYPDKVRIVYRDFPLHNNSIFLALSARCAGEQGKFWLMHDLFYENQDTFNVGEAELKVAMPDVAEALEMDVDRFRTCLIEQRYFPLIEKDFEDASFLEIQGTPTWFINNRPIVGHISVDDLEEMVSGTLRALALPKTTNTNE